jgi:acetyl-CoA C-acetyltransferase
MSLKGKAYIVGAYEHPTRKAPDTSLAQLHAEVAKGALDDAGLSKSDVDGYFCASGDTPGLGGLSMIEYMGLKLRHIDATDTGGSSYNVHVGHALQAIAAGRCNVALVTLAGRPRSEGMQTGTAPRMGNVQQPDVQFEFPYGPATANMYAMAARRHMHEFGTTSEQLAEIAVGIREFAGLNPDAMYRDPITVADVVGSRLIADPLHKLDCCVVSDGGGALLITTAERARDLRQPPVYVLGSAAAMTHWTIAQMPDFTETAAAKCGPEAMARAGIRPENVDTLQLYDSFTITVLLLLEGLGFCKKGEGGPFVHEGHLRRGGRVPLNTDGGGLSACHPGMRGIFLLAEAARQLRGQAGEAQVPDCGIALACGSGGSLSCMSAVVLGREHP